MSNFKLASSAAAVAASLIFSSALAETLEELKGLSIDTEVVLSTTFRMEEGTLRGPVTQLVSRRIYISLKGNVFEEFKISPNSQITRQWQNIAAPDKLSEVVGGRIHAWTIDNGQLIQINKLAEGFHVLTIAIDRSSLTCTIAGRDEPDPKTGRVVVYSAVNDLPSEIYSRIAVRSTCKVTKGNVFDLER